MYKQLDSYIQNLVEEGFDPPAGRKKKLKQLAEYVIQQQKEGETARLTFICTHNSRRSHLCQIWAATAAYYFGLSQVETYSGGTEATAFNPNAVRAVERAGFRVESPGGENPQYRIYFAEDEPPLVCFSKTFDDPYNPKEEFAAIMTCTDADQRCPTVPGASVRISIPYVDPKEADGTPQESRVYDERCLQIATEMFYLMSQV